MYLLINAWIFVTRQAKTSLIAQLWRNVKKKNASKRNNVRTLLSLVTFSDVIHCCLLLHVFVKELMEQFHVKVMFSNLLLKSRTFSCFLGLHGSTVLIHIKHIMYLYISCRHMFSIVDIYIYISSPISIVLSWSKNKNIHT